MKYMLLIYENERAWMALPDAERQNVYGQYGKLMEDLVAAGTHVTGSELHPTTMATTVRVREGKRLVTDGPFAETREQLGGYIVVDVPDLDAALAVAERIPTATTGSIEVRPLNDGP